MTQTTSTTSKPTLTEEDVERLRVHMSRWVEEHASRHLSTAQVVARLAEDISAWRKRGLSWTEVAQGLRESGQLEISPGTLESYYKLARRKRGTGAARPKRGVRRVTSVASAPAETAGEPHDEQAVAAPVARKPRRGAVSEDV